MPWHKVWRLGANRATHFSTDRSLYFGALEVPPGTYTLYMIPEPDGGLLIINGQTGQGGASYDEKRDLGRVAVSRSNQKESTELFRISTEETKEGGTLKFEWGNTVFSAFFRVSDHK